MKKEERFQHATEAMNALVYEWDLASGRVERTGRALESLTGYTPDEAEPSAAWWHARVHPDDLVTQRARVDQLLAARSPEISSEYRVRHKDGRWVWVWDQARYTYESTGRPTRAIGCTISIDRRKRFDEALSESEERYRQLAAAMPQLVWTADDRGVVDYYNPRAAEYAGLRQREDGMWTWEPLVHPDDLARTVATWNAAVQSATMYQCEHRVRMRSGEYRWHLSRATPMRQADGPVKWFGTATDVHELRCAQEALHEADRRKTEFLALLAHELRNPLNPIAHAAAALSQRGLDEAGQWSVEVIERQVAHLSRLVDDLMDVSRITRGQLELRTATVDLADVVRRAVEASETETRKHGHHVAVELPVRPLRVAGDPTRLAQVVQNLLNNAARYTPDGGDIRVSVREVDGCVCVAVRDNGIGVDPAALPHLFDMFFQADRAVDRARGGLGIGLTLVQRLVQLHGGRVEVVSEGLGHGSTFKVVLPMDTSIPAATPDMPDRHADRALARRILVVDDNPDSTDAMAMLLRFAGHEVHVAYDGVQAIEVGCSVQPHVVLMDIGLPGLSGYEVATRMRDTEWGGRALLIAQTGWGQAEDRERSRAAGFDAHLTKPVEYDRLLELLATVTA